MLILIGYLLVLGATLGGFMVAGGHPAVLMHISEFIVIGGIAGGVLVIASPKKVLTGTVHATMVALKGNLPARDDYLDLFKILYELFMTGKKSGLIALDEHVSNPENSAIFRKYPKFLTHEHRLEFLCNGLKPIIDGKIKPDQLQPLLQAENTVRRAEPADHSGSARSNHERQNFISRCEVLDQSRLLSNSTLYRLQSCYRHLLQ